jgi:hypothetical protein
MKISLNILRKMIRGEILSEVSLGGEVSSTLRSSLSSEDLHDIRVIQIEHPVSRMIEAGDTSDEIISALESAIENLKGDDEEVVERGDLDEQEGSALMGKEVGSDDRSDMGGYTVADPY